LRAELTKLRLKKEELSKQSILCRAASFELHDKMQANGNAANPSFRDMMRDMTNPQLLDLLQGK
jgi:hypothetical protein